MVFPMIWLYILRDRLNVEGIEAKLVEMKVLNGGRNGTNGIAKTNASNGFIKDKAVIINETTSNGEQEHFLANGKLY